MEETPVRIIDVNIENEMKSSYIDYSMSVIVSRALPDVRDGLKPVQRRVLFGMNELGLHATKPHKKAARIVGEVLGKYHPHGDSSVYLAMVRMAQTWSLRYPLVDGQGNFGSIDDDAPAAMRYTEARLRKISDALLMDIDKETVDFQPNFDESLFEPKVLPTRIPNLLINGTTGIAVGMATNMPPHNLSDTIDAITAYIDNPEIEIDELIKIIKAPDFPTGGIIYGYDGIKQAYKTGKGRVIIRGKYHFEESHGGKPQIIFTEIPYMVNKAAEIQKVANLVNEGKIDGIIHANDESDRNGLRVVFTLRRDANPTVIVNKIFKYSQFQLSFAVNNIALVHGRPKLLNLQELILHFVNHRMDVVMRRSKFELEKAQKQAHILQGYLIALDHIDEIVDLIKKSETPEIAKQGLMNNFGLSEIQAYEILQMRLQRLTGLERNKIKEEYEELMKQIDYLSKVLSDEALRYQIIKNELLEIKEKFGDERKTEIQYASSEFNPEDFYANDEVIITISNLGYIKRTKLDEYRVQHRGGVGLKGVATREEDFIRYIYIASMHNTLLFFSNKGKCYWLKAYEIPEGARNVKGRHINNVLQLDADEKIVAYLNVKNIADEQFLNTNFIVLATKKGIIKKTSLANFSNPRKAGIIALTINEDDDLLAAKLTTDKSQIILASNNGKAVRFLEDQIRPTGRTSMGVKAMNLEKGDSVIGLVCITETDRHLLVVSENGYGKRSEIEEYRITKRGSKGVKTLNVTDKTGKLVAIKDVSDDDDLMIMTQKGYVIRITVANIKVSGRATQGVKLINIKGDDAIASVARIKGGAKNDENLENEPIADDDLIEDNGQIDNEN